MSISTNNLLIQRAANSKFWHYHNGNLISRFFISDFGISIDDGNKFTIQQNDGALRHQYFISNVKVQDLTGSGTIETFIAADQLLSRLTALNYTALLPSTAVRALIAGTGILIDNANPYLPKISIDPTFLNLPFYRAVVPTDTPEGTTPGYWLASQPGTYTNFGGVVVSSNSIAVISRNAANTFSISQTPFDLSEYAKKSEVAIISEYNWIPSTGYIDNDGNFQNYGLAKTTDFIDVSLAMYITGLNMWNDTFKVYSFYNSDKLYISGMNGVKIYKENFPANAKYVRYTTENTTTEKIKVANSPNIIESQLNVLKENVDLLEMDTISFEFPEIKNGFITLSGELLTNGIGKRTDFIPVEVGTRIIYSGQVTNTSLSIAGYDENGSFIESVLQSEDGISNKHIRIINPDIKFVAISGINGMSVDFETEVSLSLLILKKELESQISGSGKIIALSEYVFPKNMNVTLYKNQLTNTDSAKLVCLGANTFDNLYLTKETIQSYNVNPSTAIANLQFKLLEKGKYIQTKNVKFRSVARDIGDDRKVTIVVSGDSLVDGRETACEMFRLLNVDSDYDIMQLGVYIQSMNSTDYRHEGRGSWSWETYLNPVYETTPYAGKTNYFMQSGQLDFANYLNENFPDETNIDIFIMNLGTNDVEQGLYEMNKTQLNSIISRAKTFIDAFLNDNPNGHFIIGLPSIGGDYGGSMAQNVENFKYLIQELNALYIDSFDDGAYSQNVHCVHNGSTMNTSYSYNSSLNPMDDYLPGLDAKIFYDNIHPLTPGYKQFGRALYYKVRGILNDYFVD